MKTAQLPKIGVVVVASLSRAANIVEQVKDTGKMLKKLEKVQVIQMDEIVTSWQQAAKAAQRLKGENVDLLLLQIGSYAADGLSVEIINKVAAPIVARSTKAGESRQITAIPGIKTALIIFLTIDDRRIDPNERCEIKMRT